MKFLCTKVKPSWLTSPQNVTKVESLGLTVISSFVGVKVKGEEPADSEKNR